MGLLARTLGSAGVDAISTRARSINFATRIADVSSTLMFLNDLRLGQAAEATNLGGASSRQCKDSQEYHGACLQLVN